MITFTPFQRWWMNSWPHKVQVRRDMKTFLKHCPDHFRGEVLEVGSGFGFSSRRILGTFPQVELTATDPDQAATQWFAQLQDIYGSRLKVKEANVLDLPFDRASFDIVITINMMHFLTLGEVEKSLRQMLRVLRPGGSIGISDHVSWFNSSSAYINQIQEVLLEEQCDIIYIKGKLNYDIWAKKPYPLKGGA